MDETWIYHFPPESNRLSTEWAVAGESRPKWPKTLTSAGKVLANVFWDVQVEKRSQMKTNKLLFQQNNAPYHKSIAMMAKLHELHFQ